MGNSLGKEDKESGLQIEHPRFKHARLSVDKKIVLEEKYNSQFIDMVQKIVSLNSQKKKIPLLLPKIE